jgi:hypothetical protein
MARLVHTCRSECSVRRKHHTRRSPEPHQYPYPRQLHSVVAPGARVHDLRDSRRSLCTPCVPQCRRYRVWHCVCGRQHQLPAWAGRCLTFQAAEGTLKIESKGEYAIQQKLETITVLGVRKPAQVTVQGWMVQGWTYEEAIEELSWWCRILLSTLMDKSLYHGDRFQVSFFATIGQLVRYVMHRFAKRSGSHTCLSNVHLHHHAVPNHVGYALFTMVMKYHDIR